MRREPGWSQAFPVWSPPQILLPWGPLSRHPQTLRDPLLYVVQIYLFIISFLGMWQRELKARWRGRTELLVWSSGGFPRPCRWLVRNLERSSLSLGCFSLSLLVCGTTWVAIEVHHGTCILWFQPELLPHSAVPHSGIRGGLENTVFAAQRELQEKIPSFC